MRADRLSRAKFAYTTRHALIAEMVTIDDRAVGGHQLPPATGDLVLARVEELGQHARLESRHGRRAHMFTGDEIVVCFANRYAPDQFEAEVPADLGPCDLVAAGGVAAKVLCSHNAMIEPTRILPIGFICDGAGERLNLERFALPPLPRAAPRPPTLAVVGTSMNAGKTTTAVSLVRGLSAHGLKVGAAKITGTGAGGDIWQLADAGAHRVLDFTDAGLASTYRVPVAQIERSASLLCNHLVAGGADAIVLEVADGISQCETAMLLRSRSFLALVDRFLFAAGDALGAVAGLQRLHGLGVPVAAVSGLLTASPLAMREAERLLDLPVINRDSLCSPDALDRLGLVSARRDSLQAGGTRKHEPGSQAAPFESPAPALASAVAPA